MKRKQIRKAAQDKASGKRQATQDTAPIPVGQQASSIVPPSGYRVKAQVTLPVLVLKADKEGNLPKPRNLLFNEKIHESTYRDPDPAKAKEKPADIAGVTDLESGEVVQFIVPAVVKSQLERSYPDETYVGKAFRIACLGKRPGKRYWDFSIFELEKE